MDYGKDNIRVNSICPSWIMTERYEKEWKKIMPEIEKLHMINRVGTPEDIAWAAVYLASDESTWVTGASFFIDGGYTAK